VDPGMVERTWRSRTQARLDHFARSCRDQVRLSSGNSADRELKLFHARVFVLIERLAKLITDKDQLFIIFTQRGSVPRPGPQSRALVIAS
jgi:hypothetical protein